MKNDNVDLPPTHILLPSSNTTEISNNNEFSMTTAEKKLNQLTSEEDKENQSTDQVTIQRQTVEEPDLRYALNFIENVYHQKIASLEGDSNFQKESLPRKKESFEIVSNFIRSSLERITRPASVEECENLLQRRRRECQYCEDGDDENFDNYFPEDCDDIKSSSSDEKDSESYMCSSTDGSSSSDEEDDDSVLLDKVVHDRVKFLREEVRCVARRVLIVRKEMPKKFAELTLREMEILRSQEECRIPVGADDEPFDEDVYEAQWAEGELDNSVNGDGAEPCSTVKNMEKSLTRLNLALTSIENTVPDKMEGLQQTIETIQKSLDRRKRIKEEGETKVLSATEKALFSKTNDGSLERRKKRKEEMMMMEKELEEEKRIFEKMPPEMRYHLHMSQGV